MYSSARVAFSAILYILSFALVLCGFLRGSQSVNKAKNISPVITPGPREVFAVFGVQHATSIEYGSRELSNPYPMNDPFTIEDIDRNLITITTSTYTHTHNNFGAIPFAHFGLTPEQIVTLEQESSGTASDVDNLDDNSSIQHKLKAFIVKPRTQQQQQEESSQYEKIPNSIGGLAFLPYGVFADNRGRFFRVNSQGVLVSITRASVIAEIEAALGVSVPVREEVVIVSANGQRLPPFILEPVDMPAEMRMRRLAKTRTVKRPLLRKAEEGELGGKAGKGDIKRQPEKKDKAAKAPTTPKLSPRPPNDSDVEVDADVDVEVVPGARRTKGYWKGGKGKNPDVFFLPDGTIIPIPKGKGKNPDVAFLPDGTIIPIPKGKGGPKGFHTPTGTLTLPDGNVVLVHEAGKGGKRGKRRGKTLIMTAEGLIYEVKPTRPKDVLSGKAVIGVNSIMNFDGVVYKAKLWKPKASVLVSQPGYPFWYPLDTFYGTAVGLGPNAVLTPLGPTPGTLLHDGLVDPTVTGLGFNDYVSGQTGGLDGFGVLSALPDRILADGRGFLFTIDDSGRVVVVNIPELTGLGTTLLPVNVADDVDTINPSVLDPAINPSVLDPALVFDPNTLVYAPPVPHNTGTEVIVINPDFLQPEGPLPEGIYYDTNSHAFVDTKSGTYEWLAAEEVFHSNRNHTVSVTY